MSEPRYRRVSQFVGSQVWAIREATMDTIVDVLRMRADGIELTRDEIRARIGAAEPASGSARRGAVGVLPLQGVIAPKMNLFMEISGGTSLEKFMRDFRELRDDDAVSAILLDIDTPGGSAFLVAEAAAEILAARAVKPIIGAVRPVCASAGLWLASACSEIVVTPSGEIGSLGVFMVHKDWSAANEAIGVKTTYIHAGRYKVEGNPDEPLAEEARDYLQQQVDAVYSAFLGAVAKGRGRSVADVREHFGQGRMLLAKDAKAAGVVDRIATFEDTLDRLAGRRGRSAVGTSAAQLMPATSETRPEVEAAAASPSVQAGDPPVASPQAAEAEAEAPATPPAEPEPADAPVAVEATPSATGARDALAAALALEEAV